MTEGILRASGGCPANLAASPEGHPHPLQHSKGGLCLSGLTTQVYGLGSQVLNSGTILVPMDQKALL